VVAQRVQQFPEELVRGTIGAECFEQRSAGLSGDVDQRPERARGGERLSRAPEHARLSGPFGDEVLEERGLADAGLPTEEKGVAVSLARAGERAFQQRQRLFSLQ
jgi:hypothetical protein